MCCVRHPLWSPSALVHHSLLHCFCGRKNEQWQLIILAEKGKELIYSVDWEHLTSFQPILKKKKKHWTCFIYSIIFYFVVLTETFNSYFLLYASCLLAGRACDCRLTLFFFREYFIFQTCERCILMAQHQVLISGHAFKNELNCLFVCMHSPVNYHKLHNTQQTDHTFVSVGLYV